MPPRTFEVPDFDTFWEKGVLTFGIPESSKQFVRYGDYREDPLLEPLGTPSGKIEIFSRNIEKMGYADCPAHPTWMEPIERTGTPDAKFPMHVDCRASGVAPALAALRYQAAQ